MSSRRVLRSGAQYPNLGLTNRYVRKSNNCLDNMNVRNEDNVDNEDNEDIDNYLEDMNEDMSEEEDEEIIPMKPTLYSGLRQEIHKVERSPQKEYNKKSRTTTTALPKTQKSTNCLNWILFILLFAVTLSYSFVRFDGKRFFANYSNENNSTEYLLRWQTFDKKFNDFELKYTEVLPDSGLKVLKTAIKSVMTRRRDPFQWSSKALSPAVVLLIGSKDNSKVLECVERDFVNSINTAFNENNLIRINGKSSDSRDIVQKFEQNFGFDKKHTIVIESVESIAPEDVIALHQFTDHQNAKYKDIVIVLTAIDYKNFELTKNATLLEMDSIATQLFQMKWKNALKEEQRFALISRLTPSVVTVIGTTDTPEIRC